MLILVLHTLLRGRFVPIKHDNGSMMHEYIGGCSVHWGMFSTSGFSIEIERFLPICSPTCNMISPDVLMISPDVLMISPDVLMLSPDVLNIPRCTRDIPHMHHDIPRSTENPLPPMYS